MRLTFTILLFAFCASAQMPPTNFPVMDLKFADTNPQPNPVYSTIGLSWKLSPSPNVESQILYRSPTVPYQWGMLMLFDNQTTNCIVECTNPPEAFFTLQAINSNGVASLLPE
jgi:hypothetical protein